MMFENLSFLGLFVVCFISSSLYPLASEAFVVGFVLKGFDPFMVLGVGSLGNTLGALSTYFLGYLGESFARKYFSKSLKRLEKWNLNVKKFGALFAFLSFLPLFGDVFVLSLALAKYPFLKAAFFIALGKFLRYAFLIFITLNLN